jgi:hypothetical protein
VTETSGILDAIDGALADYALSEDAMRWAPPGDREAAAEPTAAVRVASASEYASSGADIGGWADQPAWSVVRVGRPFALPPDRGLYGLPLAPATPFRPLSGLTGTVPGPLHPGTFELVTGLPAPAPVTADTFGRALADFGRAVAEAFRPVVEWAAKTIHDVHRTLFPRKHRRCVRCHPKLKPKPLAVDGHAYRRRQRNRVRRRRR